MTLEDACIQLDKFIFDLNRKTNCRSDYIGGLAGSAKRTAPEFAGFFWKKIDSYTMRRPRLPAGDLYQKVLHPLALEPFLRGSTNFRHGESESGA